MEILHRSTSAFIPRFGISEAQAWQLGASSRDVNGYDIAPAERARPSGRSGGKRILAHLKRE
jgi:hypothetical protein